ncbi:glycosyltransferase [Pedobacter sp. P351]|uniref:glycosyltransferase family 8 protein n=1 Tax=Pedobacter superstes TaxID=3133441 RepID=UPI0030970C7B
MNVAFCINRLGLSGLGVTLLSMIQNCSAPAELNLYFVCSSLSSDDKNEISDLLQAKGFAGKHRFIDFYPEATFGSLRSFHGDWTAYGILLLSDFILEPQVLYLDADLVVELDVLSLDKFDFKGKALAAVSGGKLKTEYEYDFYINKALLSPDLDSFNSGVVVFNLDEWRLNKLKDRCMEIANRFPKDLLSADQSILNAVFAGNFLKLPESYNCEWFANDDKRIIPNNVIFHFIGSPKPWDMFGSRLHKGFKTWTKYSEKRWERKYEAFTLRNLKRTWNLRRSYVRVLKDRINAIINNLAD